MDDQGDVHMKHDQSNLYRPPPPPHTGHRMPPTETHPLHGYPPTPSASMPPPKPSWNLTASPYSDTHDHRPPPPDMGHPPPYPPTTHPYHAPPPAPPHPPPPPAQHAPPPPTAGRDTPGYPPDAGYGRPGSVSGPSRSPGELSQHQPYHAVGSTPHEGPYYPPTPTDYRTPRPPYAAAESQPNGTHQPPLHLVTGHDMMAGQPPGAPPPGAPPPQYGPPSAGGGAPMSSASQYFYDPYGGGQRRKPVRAAQACDSCRQRKAKCDEGRPDCQHCKDNGLKCSYREVPPQKSEKQVLAITAQLDSLSDDVKMLVQHSKEQVQHSKEQDEKIDRLLSAMARQAGDTFDIGTPHDAAGAMDSGLRAASQSQSQQQHQQQKKHQEETSELSLYKHTTAAQHLLNWPSIRPLVPRGITPAYVNEDEQGRGLLRVYGSGEGEDKGDGHDGAPSPANSSSSDGRRMDEEASSTSNHGVWGTGSFQAAPASSQSHSPREHPGGLSPNGGLMLDAEAVDRYFKSYMDNIHILHPFLEAKVLRKMVTAFKKRYSWDYRATPVAQATGASGAKRKRETESPPSTDGRNATNHAAYRNHGRAYNNASGCAIERSIGNVIVLLVLALGKVTSHREPLPRPAAAAPPPTSTPYTAMYSDLPMAMSAPTSPFNNQVTVNGVHAAGSAGPAAPQGRNMDVIPGLAYYAKAAEFLGALEGGTDVTHVQANLLAGLYMGQLARILPSYCYINKACMVIQFLIESPEYLSDTMKPARRNLVNFAFWSALQLESDIAAEMQLPVSGITRYESQQIQGKGLPTRITLENIAEANGDDDILRFYSYQITLRRTLNSTHATLYRESKHPHTRPSESMIEALDSNLENWRGVLGNFDWNDDDHQSPHINVARMRGKYYGAKYIIWRPALRYALSQALTGARAKDLSEGDGIDPQMLSASKICIEAAIRSTTVFDKVPRRLVVTNIFGTAHAQFGNMLVLYGTFTSPLYELSSLVTEATLKRLHDRTIAILRENEGISPVLAKDLKILEHVRMTVFPSPSFAPGSATSSFSSR